MIDYSFKIEEYTANYNNTTKRVEVSKEAELKVEPSEKNFGGTYVKAINGETYRGIMYLDPTNLSKKCISSESSLTGTIEGCMKWYVYLEDDDSYTMILDHNTTANSYWNYDGSNATIGTRSKSDLGSNAYVNEVMYDLVNDTKSWDSRLGARLITADEIAIITGNDTWKSETAKDSEWFYLDSNDQNKTAKAPGSSKYAWLYDNLKNCMYGNGCSAVDDNQYEYTNENGLTIQANTWAYWTSSIVSDYSDYAWHVYNIGALNSYYSVANYGYGIRPVITISKSIIS